jgi:hypothetical protein
MLKTHSQRILKGESQSPVPLREGKMGLDDMEEDLDTERDWKFTGPVTPEEAQAMLG